MKDISNSAGGLLAKNSATNSIREIKKLHGEILSAAKTSLDKAFKIGELLTNVRENLQHGEWLPWAQNNLPFTDRTARNYIRCYEEQDRLKLESVSNLTDAYLALAELKTEPEPVREIAVEPEIFKRFNELSEDDQLVVHATIGIFDHEGRAVSPDDIAGLVDQLQQRAALN